MRRTRRVGNTCAAGEIRESGGHAAGKRSRSDFPGPVLCASPCPVLVRTRNLPDRCRPGRVLPVEPDLLPFAPTACGSQVEQNDALDGGSRALSRPDTVPPRGRIGPVLLRSGTGVPVHRRCRARSQRACSEAAPGFLNPVATATGYEGIQRTSIPIHMMAGREPAAAQGKSAKRFRTKRITKFVQGCIICYNRLDAALSKGSGGQVLQILGG